MPRGHSSSVTVTLPCPECGPVVLPVGDVAVECSAGVARNVTYFCPGCGADQVMAASAPSLALLHSAGVRTQASAASYPTADVEPARQVVSLRVLLDDPSFLSMMESTRDGGSEMPAPAGRPGPPAAGRPNLR